MIVTNKFVFVHLHKSGGTFVNQLLEQFFPDMRKIGYHYPMEMIPKEYCHLPILGSVRNPWDFYVSYYAFQKALVDKFENKYGTLSPTEFQILAEQGIDPRNGIDMLFDIASNYGTLDFAETTCNLLKLGKVQGKLDHLLEFMPIILNQRGYNTPFQKEGYRGMNVTREDLETIRDTGIGLYTFLCRRMYSQPERVYFLMMNTLQQDLLNFLSYINVNVDQKMKDAIMTSQRANVSQHAHYSHYYTTELEKLVHQSDAWTIERFGFNFCRQN